jgi:hypothetical protein
MKIKINKEMVIGITAGIWWCCCSRLKLRGQLIILRIYLIGARLLKILRNFKERKNK